MAEILQYLEATLFVIEHTVVSFFHLLAVVDPLCDKAGELFMLLTYFRFNCRSLRLISM